jgi:hypothetical protein
MTASTSHFTTALYTWHLFWQTAGRYQLSYGTNCIQLHIKILSLFEKHFHIKKYLLKQRNLLWKGFLLQIQRDLRKNHFCCLKSSLIILVNWMCKSKSIRQHCREWDILKNDDLQFKKLILWESMPCIAILISTSKTPCSFLLLLILSLQQN